MPISRFDRKLEILRFVIFLYGKLIQLAVRLEQQGLDTTDVRAREAQALQLIDALRADMRRDWHGSAAAVMRDLRDLNSTAQRKARELEQTVDKVGKLTDVLHTIDRAMKLVGGLMGR